ncbi:hypothetical protein [Isachenkonia alkalipeptolytica]|uniref:Uncharacterized protein n=1 Tax=Isachenkonia alkalipeptolytica TaxID=2565777 RepID=A0AA44BDZ6_9CLOT|nr:hypothetical protein [Isachenkonia alkalipeptolytica]NBG88829.1 hypothetical protein [Isachenkonia alkalipeptolytica]
MGDFVVVIFTAGLIFFMISRGGCCGGGFNHPPQNHGNQKEQTNNRGTEEGREPGSEHLKSGSNFLLMLALSVGIAAVIYFL